MATWEMTCTCGDKVQGEGETAEEAVDAVYASWTPEVAAQHIADKHQGEVIPSQEEARAGFIASAVMV
jgi:hypothetical protein